MDYDEKIKALDEKFKLIQDYNEKALKIATKEMERRLDGLNHNQKRMDDQTNTFMTRSEYELKHQIIQGEIKALSRLVYIGIGILLVLEIVLRLLLK